MKLILSSCDFDDNIIESMCDAKRLSKELARYKVTNTVSKIPTAYLCNYAYYRVLQATAGHAVFLHIPPEKHITEELKTNILSAVKKAFG